MAETQPISPATIAVAAGRPAREPGQPLNSPIVPATALIPGRVGDDYARAGHPGWSSFEQVVGELEGGSAVAFGSGMAATVAVVEQVPRGGTVVVGQVVYSGTWTLLKERAARGDICLKVVADITDTDAVLAAAEDAAMLWLESPTNPTLEVADLAAICSAIAPFGTLVTVDNTFATPLRQQPLRVGADFVVHSASKLLSGHSDVLMGVVVAGTEAAHAGIQAARTQLGAVPGSLEIYLATRGVRTLAVRLDRAEANARVLADRLADHPGVVAVRYPNFGTIVSFELTGGVKAADAVTSASRLITFATSLGGVESTWERRRRNLAEPESVPPGLIRLSVGIEDVEDLWTDITHALATL